jgi:nucleotide-binding universal stress UspA family protein
VVVGLDGSDASRVALEQALAEAGRLGAEVTAVAAYSAASYWSDAYVVLVPPPDRLRENAQRGAEAMVSAVVGAAQPAVPVRTTAVEGPAGEVLVSAAEDADLLVVGGRGHGAIRGMLLGSVALHCVVHAACPVMVVPVGRSGAAVA